MDKMEEAKATMKAQFQEIQKAKAKKTLTLNAPKAVEPAKTKDLRDMLNEEYKAEESFPNAVPVAEVHEAIVVDPSS